MTPEHAGGGLLHALRTVATRIGALRGWRRQALACSLGALATLSLPPVHALPVLYLSFPTLVWLLPDGLRPRTAFLTGWWFGMGYFVAGLYWIGFAPVTFSDSLLWVVPFATVGLPILLSLFFGAAALAAGRVSGGALPRACALALAFGVFEWLRGHVLSGFPWNLPGYGWTGSAALAQSAALFGMYGVTLLAVLSASLPAAAIEKSGRRRALALGLAIAVPLAAWTGGAIRLAGASPARTNTVDGVGLRLVQPNIPQREKWTRSLLRRNFDLFRTLSIADRPAWITHVIWPETAATFDLSRLEPARASAAAIVPPGGLLLTGSPRRADDPPRVWNSLIALDASARVVGTFDKFHLVPFGEFMPFRSILPFDKITPGTLDFSAGPGPQTLRLPGLPPVSPLICYEVIFPGETVDPDSRPAWLLNLTNDAWYGMTAGPHQHLAIARIRAIEEGVPLVRSANTGITAVFDAYGREVARLGLGVQGVLDIQLPRAIGETLYSRYGDFVFLALIFGFVLPILLLAKHYSGTKKHYKDL